jgi:hypothetical protein
LCVALGLDPAKVGVRGIEPTDLILLSSSRLVVINNRQDSLLLEMDFDAPFQTPRVLTRFKGAAFGAAVSPTEILVTTPTLNRISRVTLAQVEGQVTATLTLNVVNSIPVTAVRIGDGGAATLAVLMSDHRLLLISELTGESYSFNTINGHSISAWHPMAADEHGRLWLVVGVTERRLIGLSPDGTVLHDFASDLVSPFSIDAAHGQVLVIDRNSQRIQHVDVATGMSETMKLPHQRPRNAQILGPTEWLIIHDTNPHVGITHFRDGKRSYEAYTGGRWLSDLALDALGRSLVLDFNGSVVQYDVSKRAFRPAARLPIDGTVKLKYYDDHLWVVSPADSAVAIMKQGATGDVTLWSDTRAVDVIPSNGGAWLVTESGLQWRPNYADPAWWP